MRLEPVPALSLNIKTNYLYNTLHGINFFKIKSRKRRKKKTALMKFAVRKSVLWGHVCPR